MSVSCADETVDWLIDWLIEYCFKPYRQYSIHITIKKKTKRYIYMFCVGKYWRSCNFQVDCIQITCSYCTSISGMENLESEWTYIETWWKILRFMEIWTCRESNWIFEKKDTLQCPELVKNNTNKGKWVRFPGNDLWTWPCWMC